MNVSEMREQLQASSHRAEPSGQSPPPPLGPRIAASTNDDNHRCLRSLKSPLSSVDFLLFDAGLPREKALPVLGAELLPAPKQNSGSTQCGEHPGAAEVTKHQNPRMVSGSDHEGNSARSSAVCQARYILPWVGGEPLEIQTMPPPS